ncbi:MAG TPA: aminotransferase class III-fold pyridoxal phosphate-dependent enzyme [Solirubrobacterales bacterium]|nr:aminotransferase class III-fold pyridoxal phosphate-dependent enzyme [Solirubrobacterales bacterium]
MSIVAATSGPVDEALRARASTALPKGIYGHVAADLLWQGAPQFVSRAEGSRFWDVDGNEYVDLMCSWGPILLGHRHPAVEEAVERQHGLVDCGNGPSPVMVDLAERLVEVVDHAAWTLFAKNGGDATTLCLMVARAHTGRGTILMAEGAYHGSLPWCCPGEAGVVPGDRAHIAYYRYNDLESVAAAAQHHSGDLAGIIVSPFRHDAGFDQEMPDAEFARGLRELCDRTGALLILDDVRCGFRLAFGSSWEPLGITPDLSAWSKGIANGYAISAVLGADALRGAAASLSATGSFWFAADSMAAALATIDVLERERGVEAMSRTGRLLWEGIERQAGERGVEINLTGHMTMPYLTFPGDRSHRLSEVFAGVCAREGVFVHPRHNWFISTALTEADAAAAVAAMGHGFDAVAEVRDAARLDG